MSREPVLKIANANIENELLYISLELLRQIGINNELKLELSGETQLILSDKVRLSESVLLRVFNTLNLSREKNGKKDIHGRYNQNNISWNINDPELSEIIEKIKKDLRIEPSKKFKIIFTHDIDWVTGLEPVSIIKSFKSTFRSSNWLSLKQILNKDIFFQNYTRMIDIEKKYNVKTWNFVLSDQYGIGRYSTRYSLNWKSSKKLLKLILDSGNEIGLHGSYKAMDINSYKLEAETLSNIIGRKIIAHRNHYLRFNPEKIWSQLYEAGIEYDFSVGFSDKMGFRSGIAAPYYPYDPISSVTSKVKEFPLIFMERNNYLTNETQNFNKLKDLIKKVKEYNGCVSILFHPESFVLNEKWLNFYDQTIRMAVEMGADVSGNLTDL